MAQQPHSGQPWSSSNLGSSTTVFHKSLFKIHAARRDLPHKHLQPPPTTTTATVLVRDPPRTKLPPGSPSGDQLDLNPPFLTLTRFAGKSDMAEFYITSLDQQKLFLEEEYDYFLPSNVNLSVNTMTRKRRSLSNLLIHPFLKTSEDDHTSSSPYIHDLTSSSSLDDSGHDLLYPQVSQDAQELVSPPASRGSSPPPDFLFDDDPFANYTAPIVSPPSPTKSTSSSSLEIPDSNKETPPKPRSPLSPTSAENRPPVLPSPPRAAPPTVTRAHSGRVRHAYERPAFSARPSLPSLDALAQMNVVLPRKPRKGRVGAKLPFEPWDNLSSDDGSLSGCSSQESVVFQDSVPELSVDSAITGESLDFVAELEADFAESFGDEYDGPHAGYFSSAPGPSSELSPFSQSASTSGDDEDEETSEISYLSDSDSQLEEIEEEELFLVAESSSSSSCVMPILTRTISATSTSSSSDFSHELSSSNGHETSLSSAEDSDILASPPQPFLSAPALSRFPSVATTQMSWSPTELYDSLKDPVLTDDLLFPTKDLEESCELGTSATTIRPSSTMTTKPLRTEDVSRVEEEEVVDAGEYERYQGYGGSFGGFEVYGNGDSGSGRRGYGQSRQGGGGTSGRGGAGGRGDGDGGRDPRRPPISTVPTQSDSESEEASETDDDVPIAQSIPGALKAQKSLRQQVRSEHKKRKQEKALEAATSPKSPPRPIQVMSRPPGAGEPAHGSLSSSREAASYATRSKSLRRPSTADSTTTRENHFSPDDLARQLRGLNHNDASTTQQLAPAGYTRQRAGSVGHALREQPPSAYRSPSPPQSPQSDRSRGLLRPMRSFHRPEKKRPMADEHGMVPIPTAAQSLGRSLTRVDPRKSEEQTRQPRKSMDENRSRSARSSSDAERAPRPSLHRPPMPPLPSAEAISTSPPQTQQVTPASQALVPPTSKGVQQRIFVGDMQRFNMVEITNATAAGDVIEMVNAQGSLEGWVGSGGWMVWEIAHDFGMERPIRSYELLADVQASWNQDKMMNSFVIRITPLAIPLSRSAMPSASPTHSGYVEWESKRGKWNKRWLQLREHSLWLSKRDNGRDEVMLCSLSNFDAYFITRPYKSPKAFTFAIKSTDNLSYFENTNDYLHIFSCSEKDGNAWIEKILVARSYVLHQERNVLFNPKGNAGASTTGPGGPGGLSRAGTRKGPQAPRPAQPLVSVVTPETSIHHPPHSENVFKIGSLLRKA